MARQDHPEAKSPFELSVPMRPALLVAAALLLAGLIFLYIETYNMTPPLLPGYPGDAFFPRLVVGFTMIFAVVILVRGLFLPQDAAAAGDEASSFTLHWPEFLTVCVLVVAYAQLLEPLGFEITTFALLMILLVPRLRAAPGATAVSATLQALALTVPAVLILYAGFALFLNIPLPLRFLPSYVQF